MGFDEQLARAVGLAALFVVLVAGLNPFVAASVRAEVLTKAVGGATEPLVIVTAGGRRSFTVEIADEPAEQSLGLMYRTALAAGTGMLFVHPKPKELAMWMRNTYIPLDMVFIRADGIVHRIASNTEPMSETLIPSKGLVTGVLEIGGGEAQRLGIKPGDKVEHRLF
ncbi:MAG: DUF192 domain-containing protein [Hyphomicrobium sp.]|nr:DUF192 domain-containing protein [Hyphomicrobium sp.]